MSQKGFANIIRIIIIIAAIGIAGYFALVKKSSQTVPPLTDLNFIGPILENKLPIWTKMWREVIPNFSITLFKKVEQAPSSLSQYESPYKPGKEGGELRKMFYVYSPDKMKFIDPQAYVYLYEKDGEIKVGYEPDSAVALVDLKSNIWKQILFCGTPCGFSDAVWINDDVFAVVGSSECFPEIGCGGGTSLTFVATLYIFDLSKNTVILYRGPETSNPPAGYLEKKFPNIDFSTPSQATVTKIKVFAINTQVPNHNGPVGCGDEAVAIERTISPTTTPLKASLELLLSWKESNLGESGLYNALALQNWKLQSVSIVNGEAVIKLSGTYTGIGVCEDPRIKAQLEMTALQFSTVKRVSIFVDGVSLDKLMSGKGE